MRDHLLRWIGPSLLAVLAVAGYLYVIEPLRADLAFLRLARLQAMQQAQQRTVQTPAPVEKKP
jgi:hypothetical protein